MKHILKPDILTLLHNYQRSSEQTIAGRLTVKVNDHTDTIATMHMLEDAQVILFDAEQALYHCLRSAVRGHRLRRCLQSRGWQQRASRGLRPLAPPSYNRIPNKTR